jgi:predicted ATPase
MVTPVLGRPVELDLISQFLSAASTEPAAVVIEGEAGIGKTTLWSAAIDAAAEAGFQVLAARPAQAESVLAYSALADMLDDVDDAAWTGIPAAQRSALDGMLFRGGAASLIRCWPGVSTPKRPPPSAARCIVSSPKFS